MTTARNDCSLSLSLSLFADRKHRGRQLGDSLNIAVQLLQAFRVAILSQPRTLQSAVDQEFHRFLGIEAPDTRPSMSVEGGKSRD
jgi:hypothetical protein